MQATHEDQTAIERRSQLSAGDRDPSDLLLLQKAKRWATFRKLCKYLIPLGVLADAAIWVIQNLF